jgi:GNAT superfamily N-acetyltransferase
MKIIRVEPKGAKVALLDFLDLSTLPGDEVYEKAGSIWWIAYDGKTPVAYAGIKRWGSTMAFLCRAGVLKEYRGRGLHAKLIRVREAWARRAGIKHLITYTAPFNLKSANNLIRAGYGLYKPEEEWGVEHALYFWKDI